MATCKKCGNPAQTFIQGRRVQGTVAGTRYRKGNYYCQACIDKAAAEQEAYHEKCMAEFKARLAKSQELIGMAAQE